MEFYLPYGTDRDPVSGDSSSVSMYRPVYPRSVREFFKPYGYSRGAVVATVDPLLNETIVVADASLMSLLSTYLTRDILPTLDEMTGGTFAAASSSLLLGVVRVSIDATLDSQEYTITASPTTDVLIKGGDWWGCKLGLYAWLAALGVDALAPSARFRVVPSRASLLLTLSINRAPLMRTYHWFEQGSGTTLPFDDPTGQQDEWQQLFDYVSRPTGHYTTKSISPQRQAFGGHYDAIGLYASHTAALDADYTHFALLIDGGNPATDRVTGLGIFHMTSDRALDPSTGGPYDGTGGVRSIYADDIIASNDFNQTGLPASYAGLTQALSVSVSDGADYCKCQKCKDLIRNIGGENADARGSDLELWRAGSIYDLVTARRPDVEWEPICYAYHLQAIPPRSGWSINPNIRVLYAPYNFLADLMPAAIRNEQWAARRDTDGFKFGVYDYVGLPQHLVSLPRFSADMCWERMREWLSYTGWDAVVTESNVAVGSVGPHLWGIAQMIWRGPLSYDTLMTEWCSKAFGAAATPMRRMFDRWWGPEKYPGYVANDYELASCFADLAAADALVVADADARSRVAAYQAFVLHLHYYETWARTIGGSSAAMDAAGNVLLQHAFSCWDTRMLNVGWIHAVVVGQAGHTAGFYTDWTIPASSAAWPAWRATRGIVQDSDTDIRTEFATVAATYTAPTPMIHTAPDMTDLTAPLTSATTTTYSTTLSQPGDVDDRGYVFDIVIRSGQTGSLAFQMGCDPNEGLCRFELSNSATGTVISTDDVVVPPDPALLLGSFSYNLALLTPGEYCLRVYTKTSFKISSAPYNLPIAERGAHLRIWWNSGVAPPGTPAGENVKYFFVPKPLTANRRIYFASTVDPWMVIRDNTGTPVTVNLYSTGVYYFDVPVGQEKTWWRQESNVSTYFLNIPNITSPTPHAVVVATNLYNEV